MEKLEKTIRYNELLHIYGSLLSDTQREVAKSYFEYDLSISEIAEEKGISRAGVEDAIKKSINKLDQLEKSLHILENNKEIEQIIKDLDDETKEKIEKVLNNYGIWFTYR
mgnify:FL=1